MRIHEEEGEIISYCVTDYYSVDGNKKTVSFSVLPLLWGKDETPDNSDTQIFLRGNAVTGQKIYKKIIAWRPDISYALPVIYVLSKNKLWMQLRRPRRSFEDDIMSTLITVHCLHFLKWNRKADGLALWNHLHKAFSTYKVAPSESHLLSCLPLIQEAMKRDKDLANSKLLPTLFLEAHTCEANRATKKTNFEADSQEDIFDPVCVLCDDGGELLGCEGKCLRSFHTKIKAGANWYCESLGYTDAQVEALQTFVCNNCQYQQHQCFVCGKLGSSDQSSAPEVFQCANAECGHFYHPKCVAELLQRCDALKAKELQLKIHSGESFVCPAHKCHICMEGEDKAVHELQVAVCRRCPKAYHRKCLPSEITFKSDGSTDQRAWDGLLPGRILIFCMDHEILSDIGTPKRDHIIFPNIEGKMQNTWGLLSSKEKLIRSREMGIFAPRRPLKQRFNHTGMYRGHSTSATFTGEKISRHTIIDKSKLSTPQRTMHSPNPSKGKISDLELKLRMLKLIDDSTSFNIEESLKGKLGLIVDRLKWYVQDGDTVVDFCCGANDFSCLMRERLHKMGKICSFKNYDVPTPKNDFNFEQKDWMTVTAEELHAGSNLIIGLNPPFGVDGCLANKFIDKALTFKPKLLILVVPVQTERLDRKKKSPYDIIWEDHLLLSGEAFYLPGSIDVNGKQLEQHKNVAPSLYLWSRPDWTAKHKAIAEKCGHGTVTVTYDPKHIGKMDAGANSDGMFKDMKVNSPIYFQSNSADQKNSHDYMMRMHHSSGVSDAAAMGMPHPYVVSDAMQAANHADLSQDHPDSDSVEGVLQGGDSPLSRYPRDPCFYPDWSGF